MSQPSTPKRHGPKLSSAEAQARLADALRENLRRRKAQIRARDSQSDAKDEAVDKSAAGAEGKKDD
jgi:hypothetical protein